MIKPVSVAKLLDMMWNEENEEVFLLFPAEIKDILDCEEVLRKLGCDRLFYEDGEMIAALVDWKRA